MLIMDLCAGDVMEIGRDGQNRVLEIKVMASASRPIDGTQMGIIEKLQQNVIWNKSNGDDFYNVFFYMNDDANVWRAGIKSGNIRYSVIHKAETAMSIKSLRIVSVISFPFLS